MITVSIVSHNHGEMVAQLVSQLIQFSEIARIIITQNTAEKVIYPSDHRIHLQQNKSPKGYGANHNYALKNVNTPFICILNPDIRLEANPFPILLRSFNDKKLAIVAPKIINLGGLTEDSARRFPTLLSLTRKALGSDNGTYPEESAIINPDWLAGMFFLICSNVFAKLGGFDESFFLYYEDVDLCWRLRRAGFQIMQDRSVSVIHDARRESRRSLRFAMWHLASMARYLLSTRRT